MVTHSYSLIREKFCTLYEQSYSKFRIYTFVHYSVTESLIQASETAPSQIIEIVHTRTNNDNIVSIATLLLLKLLVHIMHLRFAINFKTD